MMVLPNRKHISLAIWKFMTCFPAKLVTFPVWPGYWHDFGARQNLPSECLCLGQMVTCVSCVADIPRIPTLAMISSASVTSPHFGKRQLNKWAEMSALHLVSFAAVFRDVTKRSPERNGCSHSNHIPFPI